LYPALQRLLRQRVITAEWAVSENKRRVRKYRLTPKGQERLVDERSQWERMTDAMAALMLPPVTEDP
jgi:DNA-binding PadR family transcriptional regulator